MRWLTVLIILTFCVGIVFASEMQIDGYAVLTNNSQIPISQIVNLASLHDFFNSTFQNKSEMGGYASAVHVNNTKLNKTDGFPASQITGVLNYSQIPSVVRGLKTGSATTYLTGNLSLYNGTNITITQNATGLIINAVVGGQTGTNDTMDDNLSLRLLTVENVSGLTWYNDSYYNYTRMNFTVDFITIVDRATGNVSTLFSTFNRYDNSTGISMFPFVEGGRVELTWNYQPEDKPLNQTADNNLHSPLSIQVHGAGPHELYDPENNHVTFYSMGGEDETIKVLQWNWGASELGYPDSGWDGNLTVLQNMTVLRGLYVGGSSVPQYKNDPSGGEPNFVVSPSTPDSSGPVGNFTSGSQWTALLRGDTYPFFGTDCVYSCGSSGFGGVAFYVNNSLVSYFAGGNESLVFTDATRDPDDTWVRFYTESSGHAHTEFSKVPVFINNTKLFHNGTEITGSGHLFIVSPSGGTSDQTAINSALSSCSGFSSCTVRLRSGETYVIDGQISVSDVDNVTIDATGATIRVADSVQLADGRMLLAVNVSHFKVVGGKWDANNEHASDPLNTDRKIIYVYNYAPHVSEDIVIRDVLFVNTSYSGFNETPNRQLGGVVFSGDGEFKNIQILNNRFYNVGGGINLYSGVASGGGVGFDGVLIEGNIIDSHVYTLHGIDVRDSDNYGNTHNKNIVVTGNYVNLHQQPNSVVGGGEMGIYVKGDTVTISNNVVESSGVEGITVMGKHVTVVGNSVKNAGDIGIDAWICEDCLVSSNVVDNPYYDGVVAWSAHNVLLINNVVSNITNHTSYGNYGIAVHHELSDDYPNTRHVIIRGNQLINTSGGVSIYPFGGSGSLVDANIVVVGNDLRQVAGPDPLVYDPYNKISVRYNNLGDAVDYADNDFDLNGHKLLNAETITVVNPSSSTANFTVSVNSSPKVWINGSYPFFTANGVGGSFGGFQWVYNGVSKSYWGQLATYSMFVDDTTDESVYRIYQNDTGIGKIKTYYPVEVNSSRVTIPHGSDASKNSFLVSAGDIYFATDTNKLYIHNGTAVVSSQFS